MRRWRCATTPTPPASSPTCCASACARPIPNYWRSCRASVWFEHQGLTSEAVHHILAYDDPERAAALIETSGIPFLLAGNVHTVLTWINALPHALMRARPIPCTVHAMALMFANRLEDAEAHLRDAERSVGANPPDEQALITLGMAGILRASIKRYRGDVAGCVALVRQALDLLPDTESATRERTAAAANAALICFVDARSTSERVLTAAAAFFRASGDKIPHLMSIVFLARLRRLRGRLRAAAATYEEARRVVLGKEELGEFVNSAAYYVGLGDLYRERNDLEAAERHLTQGLDLVEGTLAVDAEVVAQGYLSLARLRQVRGRHADALATLDTFADLARRSR